MDLRTQGDEWTCPSLVKEKCRNVFPSFMQQTLPGTSSMPGTGLTMEMKKTGIPNMPFRFLTWDARGVVSKVGKLKN